MLKVSFARFGQPEGAAHTVLEAAPGLAPPRGGLVPLGGNVQLTRGELCDTGEVELSFAPPLVQPLDWCRVWVPGKEGCAYLGYVLTPPVQVERDRFTVKLGNLKDILKKLRWMGDLEADGKTMKVLEKPFKDFIQAVYARIVLPAGITAGPIADPIVAHTTARSNTRAELLGDTLDALVNAVAGGAWGVNAQAQLCVVGITDEVRDRYPLGLAELGSPQLGDYVNAVEVPWKKPNGEETFFAYADGDAVASTGGASIWASETLPTRITTTQVNPYAGNTTIWTRRFLDYPGNPQANFTSTTALSAMTPTWTGKLGDNLPNLAAKWGSQITPAFIGQEGMRAKNNSSGPLGFKVLNAALAVLVTDAATGDSATYDSLEGEWTVTQAQEVNIRYDPAAMQAYADAHAGAFPPGFDLGRGTGTASLAGLQVTHLIESYATPPHQFTITRPLFTGPAPDNFNPPPWTLRNTVELGLDNMYQWLDGDVVKTDATVTGVSILPDDSETLVPLSALPTTGEPKPKVWGLPRNVKVRRIVLTGDPRQIGWVSTEIGDRAALAAYCSELLRYRMKPLMAFTYAHPTLSYLPPVGQAAFQLPDGTDSVQDAQRTILDFSAARTRVEYGAPIPGDHDDPIMTQVRAIGQDIRALRGGT